MESYTETYEDDPHTCAIPETAEVKYASCAGDMYEEGWTLAGLASPRPGALTATFHRENT